MDDDDERLLCIFRKIHINLPFLEAMIHMPKGANVLNDLLSHKEKLKKVASSIKLSEEFLEMDEDELVPIIMGRPFLATARSIIDVHEEKLSLRVGNETITFNIGKSMRSRHSRDDYTQEPIEPLEWKAPENQLKPSITKPPKLELKELPEHLKYAFLQENEQLPVVISSVLSAYKKTKLLEGISKSLSPQKIKKRLHSLVRMALSPMIAQIHRIFLDGYIVLDVSAIFSRFLCLSSRMRAF
ncbi:hypothetical protein Tco_1375705 [Tanacetum coccineum]